MRVVSSICFFTPAEIDHLSSTTGVNRTSTLVKRQHQILGFLQSLSSRIGFPQRTIASSQLLYLRFHLFYNPNDFIPHEVAIACLVVASKMNDTSKKSREIILSSWALRYPELVRNVPMAKTANGSNSSSSAATSINGAKSALLTATTSSTHTPSFSQTGLGIISESDIDRNALETERKRILSLEALVLQSIAFDFSSRTSDNLLLTAKLARKWKSEKRLAKLAWQVAADRCVDGTI
jgi:CTD kinase subunit beta